METLYLLLGVLLCYMTLLFIVSCVRKNNGVADVGYGIGFLVLVLGAYVCAPERTLISHILLAITLVWSMRLSLRIYRKNRGKPEDFRYRAWREAWGRTFYVRSFFQVYMLQGTIIFLIASPIVLTLLSPETGSVALFAVGSLLAVKGLCIEAVSDWQLDRFLRDTNRTERIMKVGLWRYSRHPNYFGESLVWIGVGIATMTYVPYVMLSVLSPALITFLLLFVSGVPLLEKRWEGDPEWEAYKRGTSVFVLLPPRTEGRGSVNVE